MSDSYRPITVTRTVDFLALHGVVLVEHNPPIAVVNDRLIVGILAVTFARH
jgi:hypothetical protein